MAQTSLQQTLNLFKGSPDPTPDYSTYVWNPGIGNSGAVNDNTPLNDSSLLVVFQLMSNQDLLLEQNYLQD